MFKFTKMIIGRHERVAPKTFLAPGSIGWQALGSAIAFCSAAFLFVAARWYTRIYIVRVAGREDFLISISMVSRAEQFRWNQSSDTTKALMIAHTVITALGKL